MTNLWDSKSEAQPLEVRGIGIGQIYVKDIDRGSTGP